MKKIKELWVKINYFIFTKVSIILIFFIGLFYTISFLNDLSKDTTTITNIAFGMAASLAGLSFSCSRAINDSTEDKDKYAYAGERLLHAGILLLTASIIKYLSIYVKQIEYFFIVSYILNYFVPTLFLFALITGHGGLLALNKLLWKRINRHPEWDEFY